jgi:TetR/AcrR family transcriptional repressor of nem operon
VARGTDTRERLVETAADLWHARSYADVGVSEICEAADVRKGSFYHFFPSKQELAVAVIDRHWRDAYEQVVMPALALDSPLGQLERLTIGIAAQVRRVTDQFGYMPGCPFGNLASELSTTDGPVRERLARLFDNQRMLLKDILDRAVAAGELPEAIDTGLAARAMHAYVEGVLLISKNADDAAVVEELLPLAVRLAAPGMPVGTAV